MTVFMLMKILIVYKNDKILQSSRVKDTRKIEVGKD
jgi:hypothetical protein